MVLFDWCWCSLLVFHLYFVSSAGQSFTESLLAEETMLSKDRETLTISFFFYNDGFENPFQKEVISVPGQDLCEPAEKEANATGTAYSYIFKFSDVTALCKGRVSNGEEIEYMAEINFLHQSLFHTDKTSMNVTHKFSVKVQTLTPTWPTSCNISSYPGNWPRVSDDAVYSTTYHHTESGCASLCSGDTKCGMYRWGLTGNNNKWCWLYQSSFEMLSQLLGVVEWAMMQNSNSWNIGSKKCEDLEYDHKYCNDYPVQYSRKHPHSKYQILYADPTFKSTTHQCQALCSSYQRCRSVAHEVSSSFTSKCTLYSTTITDLVAAGQEDEVVTRNIAMMFIYERYCGPKPYNPSKTDCHSLSTLEGATSCHPIGSGDKSTCQALPGCCFLEAGMLGLPISMCIKPNS